MAMPPEVSDEEIIQAGEKLKARGAVNATRLWEACGQRGKPVRLLSVWGQHEALAEKEAAASSMELPLLPAAARHQADALKQELSQGIDRSLAAIYEGVPHAVTLRYEDEHAALDTARLENKLETQDALEALGNISEERAQLRSDVASLRVRLASVETARDYRLLQNLTLTKHSETAQQGRRDAEARIEAQNSDRIELEKTVAFTQSALKSTTGELLRTRVDLGAVRDHGTEVSCRLIALEVKLEQSLSDAERLPDELRLARRDLSGLQVQLQAKNREAVRAGTAKRFLEGKRPLRIIPAKVPRRRPPARRSDGVESDDLSYNPPPPPSSVEQAPVLEEPLVAGATNESISS